MHYNVTSCKHPSIDCCAKTPVSQLRASPQQIVLYCPQNTLEKKIEAHSNTVKPPHFLIHTSPARMHVAG